MPNFRRGVEHIEKANESRGSGDFKPFLSHLYWKLDKEEKYLLILNAIDEIPMVKMQKVWTTEGRSEHVVARTDEAIGERKDPLEETWGYPASDLNVCVAVELEPEFEMVKGRKRPVGFVVKTRTFDRKIRDDKGEPTGETEEVTAPLVGYIAQSPGNFFNHVASQDANTAPINETAALIRRVGDDKSTEYEVELFDDKDLDLSGLLDNVEAISFIGDDLDDLLDDLDKAETEVEAVSIIGGLLLDRWLDEKATQENYDRVFALVDSPARYPKKGWKGGKAKEEDDKPVERVRRSSQRRAKREEPAEATEEAPAAEAEPAAEEEKPKRASRSRASRTSTSASPASEVRAKVERMKAEAAARAAA